MGTRKLQKAAVTVCFFLAYSLSFSSFSSSEEDLTAEGHYQLTIAFLQSQVNGWQEKIECLNQNNEDAEHFLTLEDSLISHEQAGLDSLFEAHQVTMGQFFLFGRTHRAEIAKYLEENVEVAQQIANLESQLQNLVDEYESLLSTYGIRGPVE
jgi:predicted  nucleic acid-binding Zn-ribbon protein